MASRHHHYVEAEKLLARVEADPASIKTHDEHNRQQLTRLAMVHALLAGVDDVVSY